MRVRRRRRRWGPILAILGFASVFAAGSQLDLDVFRGRAVDAVSVWLDQPVTLGGRVGFRLSDGPVLVLPDLEVGNHLLTAREARIGVRFWPLLLGRVEPRAIVLVAPRLRLAALAAWRAGSGEWPALPFERLEVQDGAFETADGEVIDQVSMAVVPGSPTGPFDIRGAGRRDGETFRLETTLGRLDPGRPAGFSSKLLGGGIEASFAGMINRGTDGFEIGGPLKVAAADGGTLLTRLGIVAAPALGPTTLEAKLAWSGGRLVLSDLTFEAGALRVTGHASLAESLRAGEIQLAFGRVELEPWQAALAGLLGGASGRDLSLVLSAEALGVRGGLLRQARVDARLLDHQLAIRQLSALAPGGTEVTLFGRVSSSGERPTYEGEIDLVSDNLRLALGWLGLEPVGIAPDRLRRVGLSARLAFDGERLTMPSFDLKLDTSRMLGSGNLALTPSPRLELRLAVDRVALDPYQPLLAAGLAAGIAGTIAVSADLVTWQGIGLRDVDVEANLAGPSIDLRRLRVAEAAGARFSATGNVSLDGSASDLSFDLTTERSSDLLRLFGNSEAANRADNAIVAVAGRLQGALAELTLSGAIVSPEGTTPLDGIAHLAGSRSPSFEPGPELRRLVESLGARGR